MSGRTRKRGAGGNLDKEPRGTGVPLDRLERFGFLILLPALCTAAVILLSARLPSLEETRKMIPAHFIVRRIGLAAGSYNETIISGASRGVAAPILDRNASDLPTLRPSTLTPSELHAIEVATAKRLEHASLLRIVQVLRTEWDNAHPNKMFGNEDARDLWQAARKKMEEKAAATKLAAAEQARLASEAAAKQTTPYPTTMRAEEFLDAEARSERDLEEALNRALSRAAQDSWPSSEPTGPTDPPVLVVQFPVDPMAEDFGKYEAQFGSDVRGNPVPSVCTQPVPDGSFAVAWYARFCALLIAAILQSNGVAEGSARFVFAARYLDDTPAAVSFTFHDGTIDQFEMAASLLSAAGVACFTFLLHTRVPARPLVPATRIFTHLRHVMRRMRGWGR